MENTPYLYETLLDVLSQHSKWLDRRHRQTLAWMVVGLISSKTVSLGEWAPDVVSRARYAQSTVRRLSRWLDTNRIKPEPLYGPLIERALVGWVGKRVYVALDTSMLWNTYCLIRWSVIYRGRAIPFHVALPLPVSHCGFSCLMALAGPPKEKPHLSPSHNAGTAEPMGVSPPEAVAYQVLVRTG